jgi:hypothetical protein
MSIICNLRSATEAQLQALLQEPEQLEAFLEDEEDFGDAAGASFVELDLDEAWHGIHFLLTGTAVEGQAPLDFLERGGRAGGEGPAGLRAQLLRRAQDLPRPRRRFEPRHGPRPLLSSEHPLPLGEGWGEGLLPRPLHAGPRAQNFAP